MKNEKILDYDLSKEFEIHKLLHKQRIVESKLEYFYRDMANTGINIPSFMDETPEEKARKQVLLLLNDREKFERTYNCIWEEIKYAMP